jgi:hypothetical protein
MILKKILQVDLMILKKKYIFSNLAAKRIFILHIYFMMLKF